MNKTDREILLVQLFHILFLGVFLVIVGATRPRSAWWYYVLLALGIIAVVKFSLEARRKTLFWVLWHVLVVGPVLIWVGSQRRRSFDFLFKILIMIGSAAIGYHTIRLVQFVRRLVKKP